MLLLEAESSHFGIELAVTGPVLVFDNLLVAKEVEALPDLPLQRLIKDQHVKFVIQVYCSLQVNDEERISLLTMSTVRD